MIKLNINFISNYNPFSLENVNINFIKKKIFCKNFIYFILFLNFFNFSKSSIFVKPLFKKKFTILNAPYRYKLSKTNFFFSRFHILLNLTFNLGILNSNLTLIIVLLNNLFNLLKDLDTNLCHQSYLKIFFKCQFKENFYISNYKI